MTKTDHENETAKINYFIFGDASLESSCNRAYTQKRGYFIEAIETHLKIFIYWYFISTQKVGGVSWHATLEIGKTIRRRV